MQKNGKPKSDFYQSVGIAKNALSNWSQRNTIPSADVVCRIAKYLNTTVEYLVTGSKEPVALDKSKVLFALETLKQEIDNL